MRQPNPFAPPPSAETHAPQAGRIAVIAVCVIALIAALGFAAAGMRMQPRKVAAPGIGWNVDLQEGLSSYPKSHEMDAAHGLHDGAQIWLSVYGDKPTVTGEGNSVKCVEYAKKRIEWVPDGADVRCVDNIENYLKRAESTTTGLGGFDEVLGVTVTTSGRTAAQYNYDQNATDGNMIVLLNSIADDGELAFQQTFFHEVGHMYFALYTTAETTGEDLDSFAKLTGGKIVEPSEDGSMSSRREYAHDAVEMFARGFNACFHDGLTEAEMDYPDFVTPSCDKMDAFADTIRKERGIDLRKRPVSVSVTLEPAE